MTPSADPVLLPGSTRVDPFGVLIEARHADEDLHDLDVEALRQLVWTERLVVLRGFRTFDGAEAFAAYCARWGEVSEWPFGQVLELVEQEDPEDHIFDHHAVPLHWDGMYRLQVPELQIFHCVRAPGPEDGGRTTFSDTVRVLDRAPSRTRDLWERVTGTYRRKMAFYDSHTVSPVVDRHPLRGFPVIRYNEPPPAGDFLNPPDLAFSGVDGEDLAEFQRSLRDALYDPASYYAHAWQDGDVVVADNFSLLHGREAFTSRVPRHLRRVHVLSDPPVANARLVSHR